MDSENSSFDLKSVFSKHWKWIVGGALALLGVVWVMKRQSSISALPVSPADSTTEPTPAVDLSGITAAIQGQNNLIGSLAEYVAESNTSYQQNVTDLLRRQNDAFTAAIAGVNRAVTSTAASTSQAVAQVSQAVSAVNRTVSDTVRQVTEVVKQSPPSTVDSVAATEAVTKPLKTPSVGPALGYGATAPDSATAAMLKERASNPVYKDSEIERTLTVIENRLKSGLDITNQRIYFKQLTGRDYTG